MIHPCIDKNKKGDFPIENEARDDSDHGYIAEAQNRRPCVKFFINFANSPFVAAH